MINECIARQADPDVRAWLRERVEAMWADHEDDCADNGRMCEVGNKEEEQRYEKAYNDGCCGYDDSLIIHVATGRRFKLGCNYGH